MQKNTAFKEVFLLKKLRLIVDANVFVSALLKNSATRNLLLKEKNLLLFSPEFIKQEVTKYLPDFSKKLKIETTELKESIQDLFEVSNIIIVSSKEYEKFLAKALKASPDKKDTAYFALAMMLKCPMWSQDKALKKQNAVKVYSTKEVLELLSQNKTK